MKRLKLSLQHIEGAEVLSREQLKRILGGDGGSGDDGGGGSCLTSACTLTIQQTDGSYITRSGTCQTHYIVPGVVSCYCETGIGEQPVTSNGGMSRCTKQ